MKLTVSQQKAFDEIVIFSTSSATHAHVLSGAAGTGKSTLISKIIKHLKNIGVNTLLTATTNKAVSVLSDMWSGDIASNVITIHKLLGINIKNCYDSGGKIIIKKETMEKIQCDIIIIDEYSMINNQLLEIILSVNYVKILFVGDSYQLPPVGSKTIPVLDKNFPTSELKEIVRQSADNPIINLASSVRGAIDGDPFPDVVENIKNNSGVFLLDEDDFILKIYEYFSYAGISNIKCLAWRNSATKKYSRLIRRNITKASDDTPSVGELFITNEPVISDNKILIPTDQTVSILRVGKNKFFGIAGNIVKVRYEKERTEHILFLPYDNREVKSALSTLANKAKNFKRKGEHEKTRFAWSDFFEMRDSFHDIRPAYSSTVHKSQGSTFDTVFIDFDDINDNDDKILMIRLIYVALTRASNRVFIKGSIKL